MRSDNQPFNQSQDSPLMVSECDSIIHRVNLIRRHKSMRGACTCLRIHRRRTLCGARLRFSPSHDARRVNNRRCDARIYSRIRKSNYWCEIRKRGINNKWWGANSSVMWLASINFNCYLFGTRSTCSMLVARHHVPRVHLSYLRRCHAAVVLCNARLLNATNIPAAASHCAPAACYIRVRCSNIISNLTSHITH